MMLIKREILPAVTAHLSAKEVTLITGARQVGKTTLIKELKSSLDREHHKTLYFNLDFETDFSYFSSQEKFLQKIKLELGEHKGFIFIDEIQRKENAGLFLKGLYDKSLPYKFVVTGSGSLELKERIHESLTGRKRIFELSVVNFREFVNFKTQYRYENNLEAFFGLEHDRTLLLLDEYLSFGGYPRIVTESQKEEKLFLINELYNSYIQKDIAYLLKIDRPELFAKLIRLLAHQTGSILNYSTLAADVGISVPTLKKYLWYAENTYIVKTVSPFFRNKRKEIKKSPVLYFNDPGLRNFAINQFGNEIVRERHGHLFQNFIFAILEAINRDHFNSIHFWRTTDQAEVDFIIHANDRLIPIEVKFSQLKKTVVSRSFRNFIECYQPEKGYIVNLDYSNNIMINNTLVKFIPFYVLYEELFS